MKKLCINSRDELVVIDLEKVMFLQANGNYTLFVYAEGQKTMVSLGLTKVEEALKKILPIDKPSPFVRMGRSLIINQRYLHGINVLKQKVTLSDGGKNLYSLIVPKVLLKQYKEQINKQYSSI